MFKYTRKTLTREMLIIIAALIVMVPFFFLINIAFKPDNEVLSTSAMSLPEAATGSNFAAAMAGQGSRSLWFGMINSFIITVGSLVMLIALGSITAYTISRIPGRVSNAVFALFLVGIILPFQLGMVPVYVAMRSVGLVGNHVGMILLYTALLMPLSVFLYSGFARSLPREYEEAAQIDGSSRFTTFRTVVFPLLSPATGTVAILGGLIIWNDFFTSLIFLNGSKAVTLPVVVYSFVGELVSKWNVIFAAVIISMIPILAFYLFAQKKFIQGFAGGIK